MFKRILFFVLHEAAVWVAHRTIDPRLGSVADKVYDRLDYEMPYILRTSNFGSINNLIFGLVAKETGLTDEKTIAHLVGQVCEMYDPRLGASKD
jgi:hypothetical protein